ncbi:hypothetical protein VD0002_g8497 [Verticillium dahliae]|nr:hypothetical protein VD0002_g8497 [Verticillium dahliae]
MMVETAEAWRFTNNQVALVAWRSRSNIWVTFT